MDEEKYLQEPSAIEQVIDLSRPAILQLNGRPIAVLIPYQEYLQLIGESKHGKEEQ